MTASNDCLRTDHPLRKKVWPCLSSFLCLALAGAVPICSLYVLVHDWPKGVENGLHTVGVTAHAFGSIGQAPQIALVAVLLLPAVLMAACLVAAAHCLLAAGREEPLTRSTVQRLRRFSSLMLLSVVTGIMAPTVAGVVVSLLATGKGTLSLGVSSHQLIMVVFAAVTWQITRALEAAVTVAHEYAQIV